MSGGAEFLAWACGAAALGSLHIFCFFFFGGAAIAIGTPEPRRHGCQKVWLRINVVMQVLGLSPKLLTCKLIFVGVHKEKKDSPAHKVFDHRLTPRHVH